MSYLAIARKWRPHKFEDLVGQSHVVQTLKNAITKERVSHAYLFSGARGVGKTSVARIFAKALRCPNAKDAIPCNECEECRAISESRAVDVVEIDGASNNGVEAVRGIRENVAYGASSGKYKIYIIDEVHMLSLSAFNALLKTLEEPPEHVIFLFATTEVQKIPLTILSRCQRFEFRRLSNIQILERLGTILAAEGVSISEEGQRTIASLSDGSLRDALSLLDQVLSYVGSPGTPIDDKLVVEALGVKDQSSIIGLISDILNKDVKSIVNRINETYLAGVDLKNFAERCLEELRLLYLVALSKDSKQTPKMTLTPDELDISSSYFAKLEELAQKANITQLERMAQILGKASSQLGWSSLPRFVLEMACVRMTKLDELARIESALLSGEVSNNQAKQSAPQVVYAAPTVPQRTSSIPQMAPPPQAQPSPTMNHAADPQQTWKAFVEGVMKKRPLLGALLYHANFKMESGPQGRQITLAFGKGTFYERQATDQKNRTEIEEQIRSFFGKDAVLNLSNSLGETIRSLDETHQAETAEIKKTTLENPTVLKMKEMLGADIVDVSVEA